MRGETGLGWNEAEGKIEMDDTWSDRKLQMCERYLYFRNKDLRLFRDVYYSLFAGVSALAQGLGHLVRGRHHHVRGSPIGGICMRSKRKSKLGTITTPPLPQFPQMVPRHLCNQLHRPL